MPDILDVARYILEQRGEMSPFKLHKLIYYAQTWSLAWTDKPLFNEDFQAWRNGPVIPRLYQLHKGEYQISSDRVPGDTNVLDADQKATIDRVLEAYGDQSPQWLSNLTHLEDPWLEARKRAGPDAAERCTEVITKAEILEYYASL